MTTQEMTRPDTAETSELRKGRIEGPKNTYRPNVDILETPEALVIHADMPGASSDSIHVKFEDDTLLLEGRIESRQKAETRYLLQEYGVGDFHREFQVTEKINVAGITAEYVDGTLKVHLPKIESVKPRKIEVRGQA